MTRKVVELAYPARLNRQETGEYLVEFYDVPEAITHGGTEPEALGQAQDALVAALGGYVELRWPIPAPSRPRGAPLVYLPALVAAKVALYQAMLEQKVTRVELAKRLGVTEAIARRLIDLDHRSHIGQVETALASLGRRVVVKCQAA